MATKELRLVLIVKDFDRATAFFRDALGLPQVAAWENDGGPVCSSMPGGRPSRYATRQKPARSTRSRRGGESPARSGWLSSGAQRKGRRGSGRRGARILGGPVLTPGAIAAS